MKKGFTLVEILGVVAILAIITMVATPSIISMIKNANSKMKLRRSNYYWAAENM